MRKRYDGGSVVWVWACAAGALLAACSGTSVNLGGNPVTVGTGGTTNAEGGAGAPNSTGGVTGVDSGPGSGTGGASVANPPGITASHKVDLLLVVDNSSSMSDKQKILAQTIPDLVAQLTAPASGITDLHVGVITSSLGGHGADECPGSDTDGIITHQENDDHAWLIANRPRFKTAANAQAPTPEGFLAWTPAVATAGFEAGVETMVTAADDQGCGYESQLEAMYRFLADPAPYATIGLATCSAGVNAQCATPEGVDTSLLAQRAAFLRPDSAVVIVELSDENDCSIRDTGQYYYAAMSPAKVTIPPGSSACLNNPNDPCCYSCGSAPPQGCPEDLTCAQRSGASWKNQDFANLRCWDNMQRYGIDFLYPVARYTNALTRAYLCAEDPNTPDLDPTKCASPVLNPLFAPGPNGIGRDASMIYFLGIIGVPWQDLQQTSSATALQYQSPSQLIAHATWDKILGNATPVGGGAPIPPSDILMQESSAPRTGTDGIGEPAVPPSGPAPGTPGSNPINGHEWNANANNNGDLQYACIFPLATPRDCVAELAAGSPHLCDCYTSTAADANPICQAADGTYGQTQIYARGYPGLRELAVAKSVGQSGAVGSICPKNVTDDTQSDFGYRPAMNALIAQLTRSVH